MDKKKALERRLDSLERALKALAHANSERQTAAIAAALAAVHKAMKSENCLK